MTYEMERIRAGVMSSEDGDFGTAVVRLDIFASVKY